MFPNIRCEVKNQIQDIIDIQLENDTSAEFLDEHMEAIGISNSKGIRAQENIYAYFEQKEETFKST